MTDNDSPAIAFPGLVDLAAERVGGRALLANDEFFGPKEALLKPGRGVWIPGKYTDQGKWVDGWETRRKRQPGHDWAILRAGRAGFVKKLEIETHFFKGNSPAECAGDVSYESERQIDAHTVSEMQWSELLPRTPLQPDSKHLFERELRNSGRITTSDYGSFQMVGLVVFESGANLRKSN